MRCRWWQPGTRCSDNSDPLHSVHNEPWTAPAPVRVPVSLAGPEAVPWSRALSSRTKSTAEWRRCRVGRRPGVVAADEAGDWENPVAAACWQVKRWLGRRTRPDVATVGARSMNPVLLPALIQHQHVHIRWPQQAWDTGSRTQYPESVEWINDPPENQAPAFLILRFRLNRPSVRQADRLDVWRDWVDTGRRRSYCWRVSYS